MCPGFRDARLAATVLFRKLNTVTFVTLLERGIVHSPPNLSAAVTFEAGIQTLRCVCAVESGFSVPPRDGYVQNFILLQALFTTRLRPASAGLEHICRPKYVCLFPSRIIQLHPPGGKLGIVYGKTRCCSTSNNRYYYTPYLIFEAFRVRAV